MIDAAIAAGADAAYLSGSGPTVAAITSGAAGDIFLQRTKERVDKQVTRQRSFNVYITLSDISCEIKDFIETQTNKLYIPVRIATTQYQGTSNVVL